MNIGSLSSLLWLVAFITLTLTLMVRLQTRLAFSFITAIARSLLQLIVLGIFLTLVWESHNPWVLLVALLALVTVSAIAARQQIQHSGRFILPWLWGAMFLGTAMVLLYLNFFVLRGQIEFTPAFWLPLAGLAFHQLLHATAITGEHMMQTLVRNRAEIENYLCLGASPQQAIAKSQRNAIQAGLLPTLNTMKILGLVSLPTLMAGQLLSGIPPLEAAINQFLVMVLLICVTFFSNLILVWGLSHQLFTQFDQLIDDSL